MSWDERAKQIWGEPEEPGKTTTTVTTTTTVEQKSD